MRVSASQATAQAKNSAVPALAASDASSAKCAPIATLKLTKQAAMLRPRSQLHAGPSSKRDAARGPCDAKLLTCAQVAEPARVNFCSIAWMRLGFVRPTAGSVSRSRADAKPRSSRASRSSRVGRTSACGRSSSPTENCPRGDRARGPCGTCEAKPRTRAQMARIRPEIMRPSAEGVPVSPRVGAEPRWP